MAPHSTDGRNTCLVVDKRVDNGLVADKACDYLLADSPASLVSYERYWKVAEDMSKVVDVRSLTENEAIDWGVCMLEDNWPNFGQHFPPAITAAMNLTVVSSTEVQPMPVDCQPPIQPIQSQLRRTGNEVRKYGPIDGKVHDKSDKYCEVVSVPTSTHVAQIVGKQGSKIKLLRAKSRTHIQTPVAGQEPVFIITGVREDVLKVKAEILSASDHFTAVSEERKQKFRQNSDVPGSVCLNLIIPSYMIGLIVGRNGNTIRNIQKITETYIETPKVCENSSFRITGVMRNVEIAKQYIIEHVKSKSNLPFRIDVLFNGDHKLTFN